MDEKDRYHQRPHGIVAAAPGQESVWEYPRPPRIEPVAKRIRVEFNGVLIADTVRGMRVLETASPPTYYIHPQDVRMGHLRRTTRSSICEWKGSAVYWSLFVGNRSAENAAWSYPDPFTEFEVIRDYIAFYARKVDACFVGEDRVMPQPGKFYGGWITPELVGPFKGEAGSESW